uniref:Uncharacterized protein n=1 Tax=Parascaris equorum TaxID=6256 RepID=A0A914RSL1_PAREQ
MFSLQYDRCDQSRVDVRRSCCTRVVGLICQMFSSKKSSQHFHSRILDDARRLVCSNWYRVFRSNYPWRHFQFRDYIFTRRKFTSHAGWQYAIDHWRLRQLEIVPVTILFNLYEFIRVLTNFSEYYEKNTEDRPLEGIRSFIFKWQLHLHERGNQNAKLLYQFDSQLTSLCLINLTKVPRPFLQIGLFLYLEHLTVSPQHLDESVVILVADLRQLKSFIIYQNEKALGASAVSAKAWQAFSASNKHTRNMTFAGKSHGDLLIQPNAPVYAIIFENSIGQLTDEIAQEVSVFRVPLYNRRNFPLYSSMLNYYEKELGKGIQICDNYSTSLQYLIQKGLERRYRPRQFAMRVDMPAIIIALRCCMQNHFIYARLLHTFRAKLKLLAVRERISFGTALLLAIISASHKTTLCTRRNALLKRLSVAKVHQFHLRVYFARGMRILISGSVNKLTSPSRNRDKKTSNPHQLTENWTLGEVHEVLGVDVDNTWFRDACSSYEALQREIIKITGSMASVITDNRYMYSFENNF